MLPSFSSNNHVTSPHLNLKVSSADLSIPPYGWGFRHREVRRLPQSPWQVRAYCPGIWAWCFHLHFVLPPCCTGIEGVIRLYTQVPADLTIFNWPQMFCEATCPSSPLHGGLSYTRRDLVPSSLYFPGHIIFYFDFLLRQALAMSLRLVSNWAQAVILPHLPEELEMQAHATLLRFLVSFRHPPLLLEEPRHRPKDCWPSHRIYSIVFYSTVGRNNGSLIFLGITFYWIQTHNL